MLRILNPTTIDDDQFSLELEGFCAAARPGEPLTISLFGRPLPVELSEVPTEEYRFQGLYSRYFRCAVPLLDVLTSMPDEWRTRGASLAFEFEHGDERGRAEYEVTRTWLKGMFGPGVAVEPRSFPPAHLQKRVVSLNGIFFSSFTNIAVRQIVERLQSGGRSLGDFGPILDFGCGCGRIARAFKELYPAIDLFGSDIDSDAIDWCVNNIPETANFRVTEVLPPLPYEDNYFDAVYSISIFTHMPEDWQFAWLSELRRIIKPGGLFVTSLFSSPTIEWLARQYPSSEPLSSEVNEKGFVYIGEDRPGWAPWFAHRTEGMPEFYKNSFHSARYVHERWSEFFEVMHIGHFDLNILQNAVLCRKPLDDGGTDFRAKGFLLREKAMRAGLAQAERFHEVHRNKIATLTSRLAETDLALGHAQQLAYSRYDEVVALTRQVQATEAGLLEARQLADQRLDRINALESALKLANKRGRWFGLGRTPRE
jgi:ubiquinone/menaquinone biosynthesis C-methylase UbiE